MTAAARWSCWSRWWAPAAASGERAPAPAEPTHALTRPGGLPGRDGARRRGDLVHARPARRSGADGTTVPIARIEIRRGDTRVPVPLLYTGAAARDRERHDHAGTTLQPLRPGDAYLVDLRSGRPGAGAIESGVAVCGAGRRCMPRRAGTGRRPRGSRARSAGSTMTEGWTVYRLGLSRPLDRTDRGSASTATISGASKARRRLRRSGPRSDRVPGRRQRALSGRRPRRRAGLAALGSRFRATWGSWSAGVGYELCPRRSCTLARKRRWREMSLDQREGSSSPRASRISASAAAVGRRRPQPRRTPVPIITPPTRRCRRSDHAGIEPPRRPPTAVLADPWSRPRRRHGPPVRMGRHRRGRRGFDCSGLTSMPTASTDRAAATSADRQRGRDVEDASGALVAGRSADVLEPRRAGDPRRPVPRRRSLHPQRQHGVQVSLLSDDDPYGRWWYSGGSGAADLRGSSGAVVEGQAMARHSADPRSYDR